MVSSQTQPRQSSDTREEPQKVVSVTATPFVPHSKPSTTNSAVPKVANTLTKNTSANTQNTPSGGGTPPNVDTPTAAVQQSNTRPVKVNGGPGGSLTSEDSNYSGSSDESPETGERRHQTKQPSAQSGPVRQTVEQPAIPCNGQVATPSGWQGSTSPYVNGHSNDTNKKSSKTTEPKSPPSHSSMSEKQLGPTGRESPYLVPQLPRGPSSQPEDDWPGFEPTKEVLPPDPASSTLLAAMRSPPQLHAIPSFGVPGGDPTMVSGTFERMPMPPHTAIFRPFGPFQMMLSERPTGNHDIPTPRGTHTLTHTVTHTHSHTHTHSQAIFLLRLQWPAFNNVAAPCSL